MVCLENSLGFSYDTYSPAWSAMLVCPRTAWKVFLNKYIHKNKVKHQKYEILCASLHLPFLYKQNGETTFWLDSAGFKNNIKVPKY